MVTGGAGFLGSWTVKMLLEKGYHVRATVRDKNDTSKTAHLQKMAESLSGKLEFFEADLLIPGSFDEAARGCRVVYHMASPFTLRFKDAEKELIEPALKGTRNVLEAATKSGTVRKVVLTSSVAAVYGDNIDMREQGLEQFSEEHYNTSSTSRHQPYSYSKLIAEKEAWKMAKAQNQWKLAVINPAFVIGPPLSPASNSESLHVMKGLLEGKYASGAPDLCLGLVDVRDVARAHLLAGEKEDAFGRYIVSERTMSLYRLAQLMKKMFGNSLKLPRARVPKLVLYAIGGFFGFSPKMVHRNIGHPLKLDNTKSREQLGLEYTPLENTIRDMAEALAPHAVNA